MRFMSYNNYSMCIGLLVDHSRRSSLTQEVKIIITAISVFSVSSVLFLAIGFLCGCCYKKKKGSVLEKKSSILDLQEERFSPQCKEIQLECQKNVVELKENVAYISVQPLD